MLPIHANPVVNHVLFLPDSAGIVLRILTKLIAAEHTASGTRYQLR